MPLELNAVMIKTTGNASALRPSLHHWSVSHSSAKSRAVFALIDERFPDARSQGEGHDQGAMLSATDAVAFLEAFAADDSDEQLFHQDELLALARDGHAMIIAAC